MVNLVPMRLDLKDRHTQYSVMHPLAQDSKQFKRDCTMRSLQKSILG